ncbi:unnamed protein product, partial [Discosporangium mesarthrocarpum]
AGARVEAEAETVPGEVGIAASTEGGVGRGEGVDAEAIRRLVEWRDELLTTGTYTPDDPIVRELNLRIRGGGLQG